MSKKIKAEIEERFGFFPPFFTPALETPEILENLWRQTLSAYVNNPLPALFKEKLFAYLSRYCAVPYCIICHSCALRPLGMTSAAEMVNQALSFAKGIGGARVTIQPNHLIREIIKIMEETFPKPIRIKHQLSEVLWATIGDATQLQQVLMNLCVNARDAMPGGGELTIEEEEVEEKAAISREVFIPVDSITLPGELSVPGICLLIASRIRKQYLKLRSEAPRVKRHS